MTAETTGSNRNPRRSTGDFARRLLIVVLFAIVGALVLAFVGVLRQFADRERLLEQAIVNQLTAGVLEQALRGGDLAAVPEIPARIIGVGVYDDNRDAAYVSGDAPPQLPADHEWGVRRDGNILVSIRRTPLGGPAGAPDPGMLPDGATQRRGSMGQLRMVGARQTATLYVSLDVTELRREAILRYVLVGVIAAFLVGLLLTLAILVRRVDALQQAEADQRRLVRLGLAARTVAHELKNPLATIKLQSKWIARVSPQTTEATAMIDEEVARIAGMADRVREVLRNDEGTPQAVFVSEVLLDIERRYPGTANVDRSRVSDSARVWVDPSRLRSVLDNLIANAREAQSAAGEDHLPVEIAADADRTSIRFVVRDRGIGIDAADYERLFDPFYTTKSTGSGVGLSLSRRYAELAGGAIVLEARDGGGTVAVLRLPLFRER